MSAPDTFLDGVGWVSELSREANPMPHAKRQPQTFYTSDLHLGHERSR